MIQLLISGIFWYFVLKVFKNIDKWRMKQKAIKLQHKKDFKTLQMEHSELLMEYKKVIERMDKLEKKLKEKEVKKRGSNKANNNNNHSNDVEIRLN